MRLFLDGEATFLKQGDTVYVHKLVTGDDCPTTLSFIRGGQTLSISPEKEASGSDFPIGNPDGPSLSNIMNIIAWGAGLKVISIRQNGLTSMWEFQQQR